jgi:hypothetical protein
MCTLHVDAGYALEARYAGGYPTCPPGASFSRIPHFPRSFRELALLVRSISLRTSKISLTICRIPIRPFDYIVKAGKPHRTQDQ